MSSKIGHDFRKYSILKIEVIKKMSNPINVLLNLYYYMIKKNQSDLDGF